MSDLPKDDLHSNGIQGEDQNTFNNFNDKEIIIQFKDAESNLVGPNVQVPLSMTKEELSALLNKLIDEDDEKKLYTFLLCNADEENQEDVEDEEKKKAKRVEISNSLHSASILLNDFSSEQILYITFYPFEAFNVEPVTRCTASLEGHSEAILSVCFSPDGCFLASGSGDCTVRVWDIYTETPLHTLRGHSNWVLCVCWSPDNKILASAGMDGEVHLWNAAAGKHFFPPLKGHTKAVTDLAWQPIHLVSENNSLNLPLLASCSKDNTIRIWNPCNTVSLYTLCLHTNMVSHIRWSGEDKGYIYSASRDTTIKVWNPNNGKMIKELKGHAHWVNTLALNSDYILRTGHFEHSNKTKHKCGFSEMAFKEIKEIATKRYKNFIKMVGGERLVSGSDDFTMFLWNPTKSRKFISRFQGHQQTVNHVIFSADGKLIASASFDKSIRLWNGITGEYLMVLRGHVGCVYRIAFSCDSKMLVSASQDSTLKVWNTQTGKLKFDLPGHADEVYAVDWSPDGQRVASGSKDRILKIWRH